MSIVGDIVGGGAKGILDGLTGFADALFTSDEERLDKQALLERLRQQPHKLQALINLQEAKHRTVFVAGWRPFIGWVCGVALVWHFVGRDLAVWAAQIFAMPFDPPELAGTGELLTLVLALLGLGGMRSFEKDRGLTK